MALIVIVCIFTVKAGRCIFPPGTGWIMTGAVLWSLPILWSPVIAWQWNALPKVLALWGLIAVWLLLLRSGCSFRLRNPWLLILVAAAILQVIYGAVQLSDLPNLVGKRPYGSFQQVNVYASFLATGLLCALWLFTRCRHRIPANLSAIALVFIPAMLVLVQSRTGYLGAAIGAVILLVIAGKTRRTGVALLLLAVGVMIGLFLLRFGPQLFPGMIPSMVEKEGSTLERWYILRLTWQLILNHPFVGNGYGSFEALFGQLAYLMPAGLRYTTIMYPHNELLYTWMEGGVVAVAGVLLMVGGILKRLWGKGGRRWAGLALLLPIALHVNLEYPLYQSVTHGITLILLLVITGPAGRVHHSVSRFDNAQRIGAGIVASGVLVFMVTGVITEVQLTRIEQQGLVPLAQDESTVVASLINPWSQYERLDFDRHVALLMKFNITQDPTLLTQFQTWAEAYIRVHNNPDVYNSLLMIYRALGAPSAQTLCLRANVMWPEDVRFNCQ
ncbi:Wzy polymerase domain-containing protein [Citrobacter farmeri]|uniref:PglL family O-oligosaccharyltransferase n=1 Tax=Citrobacter amalonaticus TaxID=35703 RepID=UPI0002B617A2|nr:O-antigen ligase family protein [Citrobacter amalonaticus]